ncbi:hypothetical protein TNCV_1959341 [Trichonephila clavipes]|nr:hypothetical protein TNCV_1959341 [Trichonephila clavipes]
MEPQCFVEYSLKTTGVTYRMCLQLDRKSPSTKQGISEDFNYYDKFNDRLLICAQLKVDLVANSSSSLPSYVSHTTPDNALSLSEDPDGIFHHALY